MHKAFLVFTFLPLLLVAAPQPAAATQAGAIAKDATGLALVEVVSTKEVDSRPSDGNLVQTVTLKIVNATGATATELHIIKAYGGRRIGPSPALKGPLMALTFAAGQRYYMEFGPTSDAFPEGVLACWGEKSAPPEVPAAIAADRLDKPALRP